MNVFDILGPVMVGPSSSHTAGVVRIGNVANSILGGVPDEALIKFHGSFAKTYAGHGSDKAIIGGLLGFATDDERIKTSMEIAKEQGINFKFETINIPNAHPNTIIVEASIKDKENVNIRAESVGGGNILIKSINDVSVNFDGQYDAIIINHQDATGAVSLVANVLAVERINIAAMKVYRSKKGGEAIMIIETDSPIKKELENAIEVLPHITKATSVSAVKGGF